MGLLQLIYNFMSIVNMRVALGMGVVLRSLKKKKTSKQNKNIFDSRLNPRFVELSLVTNRIVMCISLFFFLAK